MSPKRKNQIAILFDVLLVIAVFGSIGVLLAWRG